MHRITIALLAIATTACASNDPGNYLSVYFDSAKIKLVGGSVDEIFVKVSLTGPHVDGSPISLDDAELDDNGYGAPKLADLALTFGTQTWSDQPIALVDAGTKPDPLRVLCDRSITLSACIGGTILDGDWNSAIDAPASHQESSCGPLGPVTVECE